MMQHITHALRSVQTGDTSISPNITVLSHQKSTATNSLFLTAGEGAAPAVLMCWARRGAAQQGFPRSLQRCIYRSLNAAPSPRSCMPTLPAQPWSAQLLLQHSTPWNGFISLLAYLLPGFLHQDGFPRICSSCNALMGGETREFMLFSERLHFQDMFSDSNITLLPCPLANLHVA